MKLISLRLKNFQGITAFTLDVNGKNAAVSGPNESGKTTLQSAFTWLLHGKDSLNRSDFEIKTLDENGQALHGLDHEVEGVFDLGENTLALKKVYREKWQQTRGKSDKVFSGHTTNHFIDNVPVKEGEFKAKVAEIAPEDVFRLLTDPRYFNQSMHWEKRRKLLLEVCGDVTDQDVIESNADLKKLPDILKGHDAEDYKTLIKSRQKEINKELERIPTRIDEVAYGLPDISEINREAHEANIKQLQAKIDEAEKKKRGMQSGAGVAELENDIAVLTAKMQNLKNKIRDEQEKAQEPLRKERNELTRQAEDEQNAIDTYKRRIQDAENHIESLQAGLDDANKSYEEVNNRELPETKIDNTCPTCGQSLPADQVEAAREKAVANFNQQKAGELEQVKYSIDRYKKDIKDKKEAAAELKAALKQLTENHKKTTDRLNQLMTKQEKELPDPEESETYLELKQQKVEKEQELETIKASGLDKINALDGQIMELKADLQQSEKTLSLFDQHEKGQKRIKELKDQERDLAKEYENLEQELFLIEEFTRAKVRLLEDKINSRFELARFRLFDQYISGGIEPTCVTLYKGVPYDAGLNNSSQINVGLDIIRTLADHYSFWPPVFIDNAEAVTDLLPLNAQIIKLYVSDKHKKLNVEVEGNGTKPKGKAKAKK